MHHTRRDHSSSCHRWRRGGAAAANTSAHFGMLFMNRDVRMLDDGKRSGRLYTYSTRGYYIIQSFSDIKMNKYSFDS